MLNNAEILAAVLGQVMPTVIEAINTRVSNKLLRYIISLLISVGIGFGSMFATGQYDQANILGSVGLAFISSQTAYHMWFKGSGVEKRINATFQAK